MNQPSARMTALNHYCDVMREIKLRIMSIEPALNGETCLHDRFAQEFAYLQLRLVYELIALSCLVAHGDIVTTKEIKKQYAAGAILAGLEKLQRNFFPWPTEMSKDFTGKFHLTDRKEADFLTKEELLTEYGKAGNFLHRGTYENIFEVRRKRPVDFDKIANQAQRIFNLLGSHNIVMVREKHYAIHCALNSAPDGGVRGMILAAED